MLRSSHPTRVYTYPQLEVGSGNDFSRVVLQSADARIHPRPSMCWLAERRGPSAMHGYIHTLKPTGRQRRGRDMYVDRPWICAGADVADWPGAMWGSLLPEAQTQSHDAPIPALATTPQSAGRRCMRRYDIYTHSADTARAGDSTRTGWSGFGGGGVAVIRPRRRVWMLWNFSLRRDVCPLHRASTRGIAAGVGPCYGTCGNSKSRETCIRGPANP